MADPTITGTGAVKRAEFKLFADVGEAESPEWELQGDRIEELSLELNPNVETVTDVTGVTATTLDKYEEQTSVEPYYAKRESKLFLPVLCVRISIIRGFTAETARYAGKAGKQALFARSLRAYIDYSHFSVSKETLQQIKFPPYKML